MSFARTPSARTSRVWLWTNLFCLTACQAARVEQISGGVQYDPTNSRAGATWLDSSDSGFGGERSAIDSRAGTGTDMLPQRPRQVGGAAGNVLQGGTAGRIGGGSSADSSHAGHESGYVAPINACVGIAFLQGTAGTNGGKQGNTDPFDTRSKGQFLDAVDYSIGQAPVDVAIGDINGDGRLDVVSANGAANTISLLIGRGDGTFTPHTDYTVGAAPWSVAMGDLNRDGRSDLIVVNRNSDSIQILLGNVDATLTYHAVIPMYGPGFATVGDLNGDGNLDLAIAHYYPYVVSVLYGVGDGTFGMRTEYDVAESPSRVSIGDFNRDAKLDLAVGSSRAISILLARYDGTYAERVEYPTNGDQTALAVGDFNRDGNADLVATIGYGMNSEYTLRFWYGDGDGGLLVGGDYTISRFTNDIAVGDINRDGRDDLVVSASVQLGGLNVLLGSGSDQFSCEFHSTSSGPSSVGLGDLNDDGALDAVTGNPSSDSIGVMLGR